MVHGKLGEQVHGEHGDQKAHGELCGQATAWRRPEQDGAQAHDFVQLSQLLLVDLLVGLALLEAAAESKGSSDLDLVAFECVKHRDHPAAGARRGGDGCLERLRDNSQKELPKARLLEQPVHGVIRATGRRRLGLVHPLLRLVMSARGPGRQPRQKIGGKVHGGHGEKEDAHDELGGLLYGVLGEPRLSCFS